MTDRQYSSESINDLAAALSKAQAEIKNASKEVDNTFFKSKYADLASCVEASRGVLCKHGLSVVQFADFNDSGQWLITQLLHSSGQWIRSYYPVKPVKPDPQALGSAITYARRYAYCAITGVVAAGEDDDGNAASGKDAKPESAAAQGRRMESFKAALLISKDPAGFWRANEDLIEYCRSAPEPEMAMRGMLLVAKDALKSLIAESKDPATTWEEQFSLIKQISAMTPTSAYKELVDAGAKRKLELSQDAAMLEGMPQAYRGINGDKLGAANA